MIVFRRWRFALPGVAVILAAGVCGALAQSAGRSFVGTWGGSYVCVQGQTGLTLSIDKQTGERFTGYFHFYPPQASSAAKAGCFNVQGSVDAQGVVTIAGGSWITRPENYVTVDLHGKLEGSGKSMRGDVRGPWYLDTRCERFQLNLQSARVRIDDICRRNDLQALGE